MEILLEALQKDLMFDGVEGVRGSINLQGLFKLSLEQLDKYVVALQQKAQQSTLSFLGQNETSSQDHIRFEVAKTILLYRFNQVNSAKQAQQNKAQLTLLRQILAKKQQSNLENLSEDQLLSQIKALGG